MAQKDVGPVGASAAASGDAEARYQEQERVRREETIRGEAVARMTLEERRAAEERGELDPAKYPPLAVTDPAAARAAVEKKEADRLAARTPEQVAFDNGIAGLRVRVTGLQLRPEETTKFNEALDELERSSGYSKQGRLTPAWNSGA